MESPSNVSVNVGQGVGVTVTVNPQNGTVTGVYVFTGFKSKLFDLSANIHAKVVNVFACGGG
jgi:hypothetical protein